MQKKNSNTSSRARVLVLVDESNVGSSVRTAGRGLDWLKLRDFLAGPNTGRELIEMVVYAGLPPAMPIWQEERDKKYPNGWDIPVFESDGATQIGTFHVGG